MNGKLDVSVALRGGKTVLENVFFSAPFKLADISTGEDMGKKVMIMNASPGVLDGDAYHISVRLGAGTQLRMETQSYQRIFQMHRDATQQMEVALMPGSSFTYIPHPSVPHRGSHYTATNRIYLSDGCRLVWGEVITPGRMLHAEQFEFAHYQSKTEIYWNEKLVVKDNLILCPGTINPLALGNLEKHTHQAGLFVLAPGFFDKQWADAAQKILEQQKDLVWGITQLEAGGFAIRLLGYKAELLFYTLRDIAYLCEANKTIVARNEQ
jgi:urease accessory protein